MRDARRFLPPAILLALLVAYAVLVPLLAGPTSVDFGAALRPPSLAHPFGTDHSGHDLFVRVAQGLRVSLVVALGCAAVAVAVGVTVGAVAAARGGLVDAAVMRATDGVNALPHLLLGIVVVAFFPGSLVAIMASIAVTHWPQVARVVRAEMLAVRSSAYVDAAYLAGATRRQVAREHLVPAASPQALVALVMLVPHAVWHEATLSFLGLGLPPDRASLGTLLEIARGDVLTGAWWTLAFPAGVLVLTTLAVSGVARAARQPVDRRERASGPLSGPRGGGTPAHRPTATADDAPVVRVRGLTLRLPAGGRWVHAATDVDLTLRAGEITALVGEAGCGKSVLASALCGLLPPGTRATGSVRVAGDELLGAPERRWRDLRGRVVGLSMQSAAASFTPVRTVGAQLAETLAALGAASEDPESTVPDLLARVGLRPDDGDRYPHELSGGMAQRAALAAALAGDPAVLLADEPTAGLDPELAAQVLGLLREVADAGTAVLLVTHDLQALETSGVADRLAVMYAGRVVEEGGTGAVLRAPRHDYTAALLGALPSRGLVPVPGTPPELTDLDPATSFADRLGAAGQAAHVVEEEVPDGARR
ncbi:dipeptide/oligopeptide/nickel ABC transporter permease/ATP-binding protein [Isoptericola sp. NPDC056573]|uniref:dipeptide/oligopeptide/nickel ABC transporter permease/ATP-binding protein n=1 Tax=Isoptericola sp. NPDC056573 TaxID=3345868 RepID=UPI0036B1E473